MKKKILITGAGGFLGINLLREGLLHEEYELWAVSSNAEKIKSQVNNDNIIIVPRECPLSEEFKDQEFYCVINCAYPRNTTGFEIADGLDYLEKLFLAFSDGQVQSIINISSQSVYDDQRTEPATEESPICLKTPYAVGKYMTEKLLDAICHDIPHTNVRMASLIGPGFDQRIVNRFVKDALDKRTITVIKTNQSFGFLDIRDAANGIFSLVSIDPLKWEQNYNLGNGEAYSVEDIANAVVNVFQAKNIPVPKIEVITKEGSSSTAVDAKLLENITGWKSKRSLADSIDTIMQSLSQI